MSLVHIHKLNCEVSTSSILYISHIPDGYSGWFFDLTLPIQGIRTFRTPLPNDNLNLSQVEQEVYVLGKVFQKFNLTIHSNVVVLSENVDVSLLGFLNPF